MNKQFYFKQFHLAQVMSNSSIWPIDKTLSGATNMGQSGAGSDSNEKVLHISQSSSITGASPSDCLMSYPGHLLNKSYPSAEMQSVYSAAPAEWAVFICWLVGFYGISIFVGYLMPNPFFFTNNQFYFKQFSLA